MPNLIIPNKDGFAEIARLRYRVQLADSCILFLTSGDAKDEARGLDLAKVYMREYGDSLDNAAIDNEPSPEARRIGNAVEVLDSIRALLNGERHPNDAERIVEMINGFLESVRKSGRGGLQSNTRP